MNLALYAVADQYLAALHDLTNRDDLPAELVRDTLEAVAGEVEVKATNVAAYFQNLEAEAEAIKAAEGRMAERRKRIEAHSQRLKDYLREQMERTGITEIKSPEFRLSLRKNPPRVEVADTAIVPAFYTKVKQVVDLDKTAIAADLKAGKEVPGCSLVQSQRLHID